MKSRSLVVLVVLILAAAAAVGFYLRQKTAAPAVESGKPDYSGIEIPKTIVTELDPGKGKAVIAGNSVRIHYSGWIYDPAKWANRGAPFANTRADSPVDFKVGAGSVIQGIDENVVGMKPGGKRRLVIPVAKGYGKTGDRGLVPPDSILLVELELLEITE